MARTTSTLFRFFLFFIGVFLKDYIIQLDLLSLTMPENTTSPPPYDLPFHTSGDQHIYSNTNQIVQYVGTNWPGHQETMIPEGLQYSSIRDIVTKIRELGLNVIRLTFAIQMVDDIFENDHDITLLDSFTSALGSKHGPALVSQIISKNPEFTEKTTRLEVYDKIAEEIARQGLLVHLDNHVSKATWCCSVGDGNAWFGDRYFDVERWARAWEFMAKHAAENWKSFASVGLRNELRRPIWGRGERYDWYTWHTHMTTAASAVHSAAPNALIFFSGLDYDTTISLIPLGLPLTGSGNKSIIFDPLSFPYSNRIVLELHRYDHDSRTQTYETFEKKLMDAGYSSIDPENSNVKFMFPMVLAEWGLAQDGKEYKQSTYSDSLIGFMEKWKPSGWIQWVVCGSYYLRSGKRDYDEGWGLLDHEWEGVRSRETVEGTLSKMIKGTLRKIDVCKEEL